MTAEILDEPAPAIEALPAVSLVMVCRNEVRDIEKAVGSVLSQNYPAERMELLICDGMSTDGTRDKVALLAAEHRSVRLVDNPGLTVPHGMNAGISAARHDIIIRMDAHSTYSFDYVYQCVLALRNSGAEVVGGPWRATGDGSVGRAVAAAFRSPFGMGGGRAHDQSYEGPVDTVYLGCWRRDTLVSCGMFDEEMTRNQDDELNLRIRRRGGIVYQSPRIKSTYKARNNLFKLARQYYQYGFWKVRVIQKHQMPASIRHLVPALFVLGLLGGGLLSIITGSPVTQTYFGAAIIYALIGLVVSFKSALEAGIDVLPVVPIIFFVFHFFYGLGFLAGIWHFLVLRRTGGEVGSGAGGLTR